MAGNANMAFHGYLTALAFQQRVLDFIHKYKLILQCPPEVRFVVSLLTVPSNFVLGRDFDMLNQ
jgi:hypothetical protein